MNEKQVILIIGAAEKIRRIWCDKLDKNTKTNDSQKRWKGIRDTIALLVSEPDEGIKGSFSELINTNIDPLVDENDKVLDHFWECYVRERKQGTDSELIPLHAFEEALKTASPNPELDPAQKSKLLHDFTLVCSCLVLTREEKGFTPLWSKESLPLIDIDCSDNEAGSTDGPKP